MNEIKSSLIAQLREMTKETDVTVISRASLYFPMLNDEKIAEIVNRIFRVCGQHSLGPGQMLDVLYEYVLKDEIGEENTVQEQETRLGQVMGYTDMEFLDFIHVHSIRDF